MKIRHSFLKFRKLFSSWKLKKLTRNNIVTSLVHENFYVFSRSIYLTRRNHANSNGTRKNDPRKNDPRKMVPGKMVHGKMIPAKNGPRKNGPREKWSPEN